MPKLNQIIAVEKGVKSKAFADLSDANHAVQKTGPLAGISILLVTHEDEMAAYAGTIVHFRDGLVERVERGHLAGTAVSR